MTAGFACEGWLCTTSATGTEDTPRLFASDTTCVGSPIVRHGDGCRERRDRSARSGREDALPNYRLPRVPQTNPPLVADDLPVEGRSTDLTAGVGSYERDQQTREPVWHHADAPEFERDAQARALLVVEMDGSARSDRLELLNDRVATGDGFELLKQRVAFVPGDLDDFSRYVDVDSVESAHFHSELGCVNQRALDDGFVVSRYPSYAGAATIVRIEFILDVDFLSRVGPWAAVQEKGVDFTPVNVHEHHPVGLVFVHAADHIAAVEIARSA
jgi:hypothetical protein